MSDTFQASENLPISERRVHSRQRILFSLAELGEDNGGIILNISEGGFALQSVLELVDDELPKMRIQFSQCPTWIETKGRVAWRSDSKKLAGVEFIDLPARARKQIQTWISSTNKYTRSREETTPLEKPRNITVAVPGPELSDPEPTNPPAVPETKIAESLAGSPSNHSLFTFSQACAENQDFGTNSQSVSVNDITSGPNASRRLVWTLLAAVLLFSIFVFVGYHFALVKVRSREMSSPAILPDIPSNTANASVPSMTLTPAPSPVVDLDPEPRPDTPGDVLQVGAMIHEGNAYALAESLRRRNFSAFVIKSETHHLYLVLIGPFRGMNRISGVKRDLEKQGFEAIRTKWKR